MVNSPFYKAAFVGGGMLAVFGVAGLFLSSIMGGLPQKAPSLTAKPKKEEVSEPKVTPEESEIGRLKADLALGKQEQQLAALDEKTKTKQPTPVKPKPDTPSSASTPVERTSVPSRAIAPPMASRPQLTPVARSRSVPPIPQPQPRRIQQLGDGGYRSPRSVRIGENLDEVSASARPTIPASIRLPQSFDAPPQPQPQVSAPTTQTAPKSDQPSATKKVAEETSDLIPYVPRANTQLQQLTVGMQASGRLLSPAIWFGESSSDDTRERFIVELTEPLNNLPVGTVVVAQVERVLESGLTQMKAIALVVNGKEYPLPPGAIRIRGEDGNPLIAQTWGDKGAEIAEADAIAFLFGSLAKVGETLNQPEEVSQSSSGSAGGYSNSSTTRRGRPNLLGAVLEGGFGPLTQTILQRNEQAVKEIVSRPNVWYIRAAAQVQVFVNESLALSIPFDDSLASENSEAAVAVESERTEPISVPSEPQAVPSPEAALPSGEAHSQKKEASSSVLPAPTSEVEVGLTPTPATAIEQVFKPGDSAALDSLPMPPTDFEVKSDIRFHVYSFPSKN
jgi:hypothetical protein